MSEEEDGDDVDSSDHGEEDVGCYDDDDDNHEDDQITHVLKANAEVMPEELVDNINPNHEDDLQSVHNIHHHHAHHAHQNHLMCDCFNVAPTSPSSLHK